VANAITFDECGIGACKPDVQHRPAFVCCGTSHFVYAEYGGHGLTVLRCSYCRDEIGDYNPKRKSGERIHWYVFATDPVDAATFAGAD